MDSTDLSRPFLKKKMLLLTGTLRRSPMGNVIHSLSLPAKSAAEAQLSVLKYEGTNISAYIRRLIEDDACDHLSDHVVALQRKVAYLEARLEFAGVDL